MDFLYSRHRLNVATSRARSVAVVVGSPELWRVRARTPEQMRLANAFFRFAELARDGEAASSPGTAANARPWRSSRSTCSEAYDRPTWPTCARPPAELDRLRRRTVATLVAGVALGSTGHIAAVTVATIVATQIAGGTTAWSGAPGRRSYSVQRLAQSASRR